MVIFTSVALGTASTFSTLLDIRSSMPDGIYKSCRAARQEQQSLAQLGAEHRWQASPFRCFDPEGKETPALGFNPDPVQEHRFAHPSKTNNENTLRSISYAYTLQSNPDTFPDTIPSCKVGRRAACSRSKRVCNWIHRAITTKLSMVAMLCNFANFATMLINPTRSSTVRGSRFATNHLFKPQNVRFQPRHASGRPIRQ